MSTTKGDPTFLTLDNIAEIVKTKVPYYIADHQGNISTFVIDKDGFDIYNHGEDRALILVKHTSLSELTQETIDFFNEKLGLKEPSK